MASSPTERTKKLYEQRGYRVEIVERWNAFAKIRQDLFGIIDLLAIRKGEIIGLQATSLSNVAARIKKIAEHESTPWVREAGIRIIVIGWGKGKDGKWKCREVDVS